jgi:hypothetical protein
MHPRSVSLFFPDQSFARPDIRIEITKPPHDALDHAAPRCMGCMRSDQPSQPNLNSKPAHFPGLSPMCAQRGERPVPRLLSRNDSLFNQANMRATRKRKETRTRPAMDYRTSSPGYPFFERIGGAKFCWRLRSAPLIPRDRPHRALSRHKPLKGLFRQHPPAVRRLVRHFLLERGPILRTWGSTVKSTTAHLATQMSRTPAPNLMSSVYLPEAWHYPVTKPCLKAYAKSAGASTAGRPALGHAEERVRQKNGRMPHGHPPVQRKNPYIRSIMARPKPEQETSSAPSIKRAKS